MKSIEVESLGPPTVKSYDVDPAQIKTSSIVREMDARVIERPGCVLGRAMRTINGRRVSKEILSIGPVRLGLETCVIGVEEKKSKFYVVRGRNLQAITNIKSTNRTCAIRPPPGSSEKEWQLWSDIEARRFLDCISEGSLEQAAEALRNNYLAVIRATAHRVIVQLATNGIQRDLGDIASGCCLSWTTRDMLEPRNVTMQHGLYFALSCSLPVDEAATLIKRAAYIEFRMPLIDDATARRIYSQASQVMARGCPSWWQMGAATPWARLGHSVELIFRQAFIRTAAEAATRDIDMEELVNSNINRLMFGTEG